MKKPGKKSAKKNFVRIYSEKMEEVIRVYKN